MHDWIEVIREAAKQHASMDTGRSASGVGRLPSHIFNVDRTEDLGTDFGFLEDAEDNAGGGVTKTNLSGAGLFSSRDIGGPARGWRSQRPEGQ